MLEKRYIPQKQMKNLKDINKSIKKITENEKNNVLKPPRRIFQR